jgi:outer membrane protein OmpA-like peptidoglycan-associated protein
VNVPAQALVPLGLALALTVLAVPGANAQAAAPARAAEPDTRTMIEALMPTATRSMRNLLVRQKPAEFAADAASAAAPAAAAPLASAGSAASAPEAAAAVGGVESLGTAAAASAPAAVPAGPPPSLSLAIQFEPNSSHVRPESGPVLGSLVAAMQSPELKTSRFVIEGHADASGALAQNQRLSQERADEVRLYLVALGVHPARLRAVGKGATQLANVGEPGAAVNRRVRVVTIE